MYFFKTASLLTATLFWLFMAACLAASILRPDISGAPSRREEMLKLTEIGYTSLFTANFVHPTMGNAIWITLYHCVIGPLTDVSAVMGAPAKVAFSVNPVEGNTHALDLYDWLFSLRRTATNCIFIDEEPRV